MDELIDKLRAGQVAAFNAGRPRRGTLDLFAADLSEVDAPEADLSNANLDKADFSGARLRGALLPKSSLVGADLSGADLQSAVAWESRWREAFIEDTDLSEADLRKADFTEATLTGGTFSGSTLDEGKLKRLKAKGTSFAETSFIGVEAAGARFDGCDLSRSTWKDAGLSETDFSGSSLAGADFSQARLRKARFVGADLSGARFDSADLTGADLTGAKVVGTSFTRADLTGATLTDVDLRTASLAQAQVDGVDGGDATPDLPPPKQILIEEPSAAVCRGGAAVLWENPDTEKANTLRLFAGKFGASIHDSLALPVPSELVLARALCATPDGFCALALVERPGGVVASVSTVHADGTFGRTRSLRLPYTPASRPVLQHHPDGVLLYGISREGPGLHVHRITEGPELEAVHATKMPTVRGFVSEHHPVIVTKGGVAMALTPSGPGKPLTVPSAFPGRRQAAIPYGDGGIALFWLPQGPGLGYALLEPGAPVEEEVMLKKVLFGAIDACRGADGALWAAFSREPSGASPGGAWAMRLPEAAPFPIVEDKARDVSEVRLAPGPDGTYAFVVFLDGDVEAYKLQPKGATRVWSAGRPSKA